MFHFLSKDISGLHECISKKDTSSNVQQNALHNSVDCSRTAACFYEQLVVKDWCGENII